MLQPQGEVHSIWRVKVGAEARADGGCSARLAQDQCGQIVPINRELESQRNRLCSGPNPAGRYCWRNRDIGSEGLLIKPLESDTEPAADHEIALIIRLVGKS